MTGGRIAPTGVVTLNKNQLQDLGTLLHTELARGNLEWLAVSVLGSDALQEAANDRNDPVAYARRIVSVLNDRGRIADAIRLLRQEAHPKSRLTFLLNYVLQGNRLDDGTAYQAFVNANEPFLSSAAFQDFFPRVARAVCAVALGTPWNTIAGSGFLIGPDLVMTNFHVICHYLTVDPATGAVTPNASGDEIFCFFDYLSSPEPAVPPGKVRHSSVMVRGAKDWLVYARRSLPYDGTDKCALTVQDELDYAVIRLAKPIGDLPARAGGGEKRGWLQLPDEIDALNNFRILVVQHPGRQPQLFDIGDFHQLDPTGTRLWYRVSAARGSSGGAAVDKDGRLFALHNAEVQRTDQRPPLNQGVRIDIIAKDLAKAALPDWPPPPVAVGPNDFWSLTDDVSDPQPVIGRSTFRSHVTSMTRAAGARVLVVTGPEKSGVGYSVKLLRRTIGAQVPVAEFTPKELQTLGPSGFVRSLVDKLGVIGLSGHPIPQPRPTENIPRWLRLDLSRWLVERLAAEQQRDPSRFPAWVVINTKLPKGEALLWADDLKDCVATLTGVQEPGLPVIDIPQLRWLFLGFAPDGLPIGAIARHDEDLGKNVSYAKDFENCYRLAWRSLNKDAAAIPINSIAGLAPGLLRLKPNDPPRKVLADTVRQWVLDSPGAETDL